MTNVAAVLGVCPDMRVPYVDLAKALGDGVVLMPTPGAFFQADGRFLEHHKETYGLDTPFIPVPHLGDCLKWRNDGGDQAGIEHAYALSNWLRSHHIPSVPLLMQDGVAPSFIDPYDGMTKLGQGGLYSKIKALTKFDGHDWSYNKNARASAVVFGKHFKRLERHDSLRFTHYDIDDTDKINLVGAVVRTFRIHRDKPLPCFVSDEIESLRDEIEHLMHNNQIPVEMMPPS